MRPLTQEFVFSFDAGEEATEGEARVKPLTTASRRKGVYYTPIETARQLRKRRPKVRPLSSAFRTVLPDCAAQAPCAV